jgi:G:T-mismatch repair DNA endonuclease (very short patch repair protein)
VVRHVSYEYDAIKNLRRRHAFDGVRKRAVKSSEPNALERKLQKALGPSFTYTGNGSYRIDNLKPDFVDKTRKIVVEAYGDYWHRDEPLIKTMSKVARYKRQGYKAIIIWESEINDPVKLSRKLSLI